MTTWLNAPDAAGLWWVRCEGQPDDVLRAYVDADGVMLRDEDGDWHTLARYPRARWSRVVTPERVEALESALREACETWRSRDGAPTWCKRCGDAWDDDAHGHGCPVGRALAVLRGATVAGERGSRG